MTVPAAPKELNGGFGCHNALCCVREKKINTMDCVRDYTSADLPCIFRTSNFLGRGDHSVDGRVKITGGATFEPQRIDAANNEVF